MGFPGAEVKNLPANAEDAGEVGLIPGFGKIPWTRKWQPIPVFSPVEFHGQRNRQATVHGVKALDTTEHAQPSMQECLWAANKT